MGHWREPIECREWSWRDLVAAIPYLIILGSFIFLATAGAK